MDSSADSASLGITTKFAAFSPLEARLERYSLQSVARAGLPAERVAGCLRTVVHGSGGPGVWHEASRARAKFSGLMVCGSLWVCPVCAAAIGERRREDLSALVAAARAAGYSAALASLTFSHERSGALDVGLGGLVDAFRSMASADRFKNGRGRLGVVGYVKAVEVTWGPSNGWHPHLHVLLFYNADVTGPEDLEVWLRRCWLSALGRQGLEGSEDRACVVEAAGGEVEAYIAKFGHEPAHRVWSASDEMAKWHSKRAGRVKNGEQRYTAFDFLRWALDTGERRPMALFQQYAEVFKGRHQLQYSPGLRALFGLDRGLSDEEAASWIDADAVLLAVLTQEEWRIVLARGWRGELLEAAGEGGVQGLERFRRQLRDLELPF